MLATLPFPFPRLLLFVITAKKLPELPARLPPVANVIKLFFHSSLTLPYNKIEGFLNAATLIIKNTQHNHIQNDDTQQSYTQRDNKNATLNAK